MSAHAGPVLWCEARHVAAAATRLAKLHDHAGIIRFTEDGVIWAAVMIAPHGPTPAVCVPGVCGHWGNGHADAGACGSNRVHIRGRPARHRRHERLQGCSRTRRADASNSRCADTLRIGRAPRVRGTCAHVRDLMMLSSLQTMDRSTRNLRPWGGVAAPAPIARIAASAPIREQGCGPTNCRERSGRAGEYQRTQPCGHGTRHGGHTHVSH